MYLQSKYTYFNVQKQKKTANAIFPALVIKTYQDVHTAYPWSRVLKLLVLSEEDLG